MPKAVKYGWGFYKNGNEIPLIVAAKENMCCDVYGWWYHFDVMTYNGKALKPEKWNG